MVGNTKPGTEATITVFRRGGSRDLNVTIAEIEPDKPTQGARARRTGSKPKASAAAQSLGLALSELTDAQKKELKLKGGREGRRRHRCAPRAPACVRATSSLAMGNTEVANAEGIRRGARQGRQEQADHRCCSAAATGRSTR